MKCTFFAFVKEILDKYPELDILAAMSLEVKPENKIFLALPCYGSMMTCGFVRGLIPTWGSGLIGQLDFMENDSLVSRARNSLAARFLRGDGGNGQKYNWLMFIDVDLHFSDKEVVRLYLQAQKWREANPEGKWPIFGGMYALKKVVPQFVFNALPDEKPDEVTKLIKVRETGTGFMLIHRSILETMAEEMPDIMFETDDQEAGDVHERHDFFGVGPYTQADGRRRYLSEDYMFCQRWRDLGGDILADTGIQIRHQGSSTYPIHPAELHQGVKACRFMKHPSLPEELV